MTDDFVSQTILDHAERMWQAEQIVAERYASRIKLLTTQALTILGAITVAFSTIIVNTDPMDLTKPVLISFVILALFYAISLLNLVRSLSRLLHSSQYPMKAASEYLSSVKQTSTVDTKTSKAPAITKIPKPSSSSCELALPNDYLDWLEANINPEILIVFSQITHAAKDLQNRNIRERFRIRSGEAAIMWGFWLGLAFLLAFIVTFGILLWV